MIFLLFLFFAHPFTTLTGSKQGTTYKISYDGVVSYEKEIEQIFEKVDQHFSLWKPDSDLNKINQNLWIGPVDEEIKELFDLSEKVRKQSKGYFDVSIGPVLSYYGFYGNIKKEPYGEPPVHLIGKVSIDKNRKLIKTDPKAALDFNGIAQGYTVDLVAAFLDQKEIKNYLVEIGGEIRAKGRNAEHKGWQIGIENPETETAFIQIVPLQNEGMATSGTYQNFKIIAGKRITHIIDPTTGRGIEHDMVSVTVKAKNTSLADAWATALLSMGLQKAKQIKGIRFLALYYENGQYKQYKSKGF